MPPPLRAPEGPLNPSLINLHMYYILDKNKFCNNFYSFTKKKVCVFFNFLDFRDIFRELGEISNILKNEGTTWREKKSLKNTGPFFQGFWTLLAGFLALDSTKNSFWAFTYRYSVFSRDSEQNIKNWKCSVCLIWPRQFIEPATSENRSHYGPITQ